MPRIEQEGKFRGIIRDPHWRKTKNGNLELVLPGVVMVDDVEYHCYGAKYFTDTYMRNGERVFERSERDCIALGMSKPFSPTKISELDGKEAEFVIEAEQGDDGNTHYRVAFVNPVQSSLPVDEATEMWEHLTGRKAESGVDPDDDLPYNQQGNDDADLF